MKIPKLILILVLLAPHVAVNSLSFNAAPGAAFQKSEPKFIRTELYFGLTKRDRSILTAEEWARFIDEIVTPRFPDGFTVVDGQGQWRNKEGVIAKEASKIFIVVYPKASRASVSAKLDQIREDYKKRFEQDAVIRVDITRSVIVSF